LGYETAIVIAQALAAAGKGGQRADRFREALESATLTGPRGLLEMGLRSHSVTTPLYVREVRQSAVGVRNEVIASLGPVADADPRLEPLQSGIRTGWSHAYLNM